MQHTDKPKDGRTERARRSKDAIVKALLSLYKDGILVPTAQEVADCSGMGIRTVFRHFNDMEALYIAGDKLLYTLLEDKTAPEPGSSLEQRCVQLIDLRARSCARIRPYVLAAQAQAWKYKILRSNYQKLCNVFRERMLTFIPELRQKDAAVIEAADLMLSFETWNRLRNLQKLSQKSTKAIMLNSLKTIVGY
jgi:AcrR family transcriptional regulator